MIRYRIKYDSTRGSDNRAYDVIFKGAGQTVKCKATASLVPGRFVSVSMRILESNCEKQGRSSGDINVSLVSICQTLDCMH